MTTLKRYTGTAWEFVGSPTIQNSGPAATIGYAEIFSAQSGITTDTALTNMSVSVVVPAGRRLRISFESLVYSSVADDLIALDIYEDGVRVQIRQVLGRPGGGTGNITVHAEVIRSPSAGSHTYTVWARRAAGSGTITLDANTGYPRFLLVEDITGSTLPYQAASVPVGVIAQSLVVGSASSASSLTITTINIVVPAGRTIRLTGHIRQHTHSVLNGRTTLALMEGATQLFGNLMVGHPTVTGNAAMGGFTSTIISPSAGSHTYSLVMNQQDVGTVSYYAASNDPAYLMAEDITPTPAAVSTGAPGSTLGYTEIATGQTGITTLTDLTGLTATVTVPAGRRLRITGVAYGWAVSVNNSQASLEIREGSTTLAARDSLLGVGGNGMAWGPVVAVVSPTAGTHTYKLSAAQTVGTGGLQTGASASKPHFILVEDITGSVWPTGSSVTAGMVASEAWTDWTPTWTSYTVGNGTVQAKYNKIGRTVNFRLVAILGSTSVVGTDVYFTLPVPAAASDSPRLPIGLLMLEDVSAANFFGQVWLGSTTQGRLLTLSSSAPPAAGAVTATVPYTWAVGDRISCSGTYEAAS